jgi:Glucose-6-phosphate dehydrogenase, C-terminal domain
MRRHEHTEYPVNDVGVTLTDRGDEMKTVIVGGVAAGTSTGARLRWLDESAEIVVPQRGRYVSFANCGLPYHIGGAIPDRGSLLQTPESPETYAPLTLHVNSPQWAGVPFTLRSGKALAAGSAEIAIHFSPLPDTCSTSGLASNRTSSQVGLTEPYMRLSTTLNGPEHTAEIRQLEARSTPPRFNAYAHLIPDMLNSNPMLFIRSDEAEEAWRIIDPVMNAWTAGNVPMQEYPAGHEDHTVGAPEGTIHGTDKVREDRRWGR